MNQEAALFREQMQKLGYSEMEQHDQWIIIKVVKLPAK